MGAEQQAAKTWLERVRWDERGLAPAVAQDAESGRVLTLAWMNSEALAETVRRGEAVYWSRSRQRLWHKGEESGHVQSVVELRLDRVGVACHTGRESCFFLRLEGERWIEADPVLKDPALIYGKT